MINKIMNNSEQSQDHLGEAEFKLNKTNNKRIIILGSALLVLVVSFVIQIGGLRQGELKNTAFSNPSPSSFGSYPSTTPAATSSSPSAALVCGGTNGLMNDWSANGVSVAASAVFATPCPSPSFSPSPSPRSTSTPYSTITPFFTPTTSPISSASPTSSPYIRPLSLNLMESLQKIVTTSADTLANLYFAQSAEAQSLCLLPRSGGVIGAFAFPSNRYKLNPNLASGRFVTYTDNSETMAINIIVDTTSGGTYGMYSMPNASINLVGFYKKSGTGGFDKTSGQARNCNSTTYGTVSQFMSTTDPTCVAPTASSYPDSSKGKIEIFYRPHAGATPDDPNGIDQLKIVKDTYGTPGAPRYNADLYNAWTGWLNYVLDHEDRHKAIFESALPSIQSCVNGIVLPAHLNGLQESAAQMELSAFVDGKINQCNQTMSDAQRAYDEAEALPTSNASLLLCKLRLLIKNQIAVEVGLPPTAAPSGLPPA